MTAQLMVQQRELRRGRRAFGTAGDDVASQEGGVNPPRARARRKATVFKMSQMAVSCVWLLAVVLLENAVSGCVSHGSPVMRTRGGWSSGRGEGKATGSGRSGSGGRGHDTPAYARKPPRDGVLYDELEVHWGASSREIKKAYYRLAVMHHPDKKPGDTVAEDRFKRVSEAYQILQDEKVRERYHKKGLGCLEDDGLSWGGDEGNGDVAAAADGSGGGNVGGGAQKRRTDPMEVFSMFLEGSVFEHLIGPLSPSTASTADSDYHDQQARALAEALERRLEVYVRGNCYWFDQAAWAEALQLREQPMGRQILRSVGYVYQNYALRSLGKLAPSILQPQAIRGKMNYVTDRAHQVNNFLSAVSSTTRLYALLQTRKPDDAAASRHGATNWGVQGQDGLSSAEEEEAVAIVETVWRVHRVNVERAVQEVCKMVVRDPMVPPNLRRKRADALMRLGRIFSAAAKGEDPEPGVFQFKDASADPLAGMATFTPSFSSETSDYGSGYAPMGQGWDATPRPAEDGGHEGGNGAWTTAPGAAGNVGCDDGQFSFSGYCDELDVGLGDITGGGDGGSETRGPQGGGGSADEKSLTSGAIDTQYSSVDETRFETAVGTGGGSIVAPALPGDWGVSFDEGADWFMSSGGDKPSGGFSRQEGADESRETGVQGDCDLYPATGSRDAGGAPSALEKAKALYEQTDGVGEGILGEGWSAMASPTSCDVEYQPGGRMASVEFDESIGGMGEGSHIQEPRGRSSVADVKSLGSGSISLTLSNSEVEMRHRARGREEGEGVSAAEVSGDSGIGPDNVVGSVGGDDGVAPGAGFSRQERADASWGMGVDCDRGISPVTRDADIGGALGAVDELGLPYEQAEPAEKGRVYGKGWRETAASIPSDMELQVAASINNAVGNQPRRSASRAGIGGRR